MDLTKIIALLTFSLVGATAMSVSLKKSDLSSLGEKSNNKITKRLLIKMPKKFNPQKLEEFPKKKPIKKNPNPKSKTISDGPIYRNDLTTPVVSNFSDTPRFIVYSRYPLLEEDSPSNADNKDDASFLKTLLFIKNLAKKHAESATSAFAAKEFSPTVFPDVENDHTIYTPEGELGVMGLPKREESFLIRFKP